MTTNSRGRKNILGVPPGPRLVYYVTNGGMLLFLLFLGSELCKFEKWPANNAQMTTFFRCWMSDE